MGILQERLLDWVAIPFSRDLPNPGFKPESPYCRQILYHLSSQGNAANWWDALKTATPAAGISQQKVPKSPRQSLAAYHTANASKVEGIWMWSLASSAIFTRPLANQLTLLQASWQLLAMKILPEPSGGRKCFPRVCQFQSTVFMLWKQTNLLCLAEICEL